MQWWLVCLQGQRQPPDNLNSFQCALRDVDGTVMQRYQSIMLMAVVVLMLSGCDTPVISLQAPPVKITSEQQGVGREAKPGDVVTIDYRIALPDGRVIMEASSYQFVLGRGSVIEGVDEAVMGMRSGGQRVVSCPPHKHWGRQGTNDGKIPANTTLTINIRLLSLS